MPVSETPELPDGKDHGPSGTQAPSGAHHLWVPEGPDSPALAGAARAVTSPGGNIDPPSSPPGHERALTGLSPCPRAQAPDRVSPFPARGDSPSAQATADGETGPLPFQAGGGPAEDTGGVARSPAAIPPAAGLQGQEFRDKWRQAESAKNAGQRRRQYGKRAKPGYRPGMNRRGGSS